MSRQPQSRTLSDAVVRADELGHGVNRFVIRASEDECRALAARLGIEEIAGLEASLELRPWQDGGIVAQGRLAARAVQQCVITLEPVASDVDVEISERFRPRENLPGEVVIDVEAGDDAEPFDNGEIDIAALIGDTLATALDPYPQAPGAVLEPGFAGDASQDDRKKASPFAGLAALRGGPSNE